MRSPACLLAALGLLVAPLAARPQASTDPTLVFDKVEAMVPMRDGVRLQTEVYLPKGAREKLPVLLVRTPYGFDPDVRGFSQWLVRPWLADLLRDGYLLALQSVRGDWLLGRFPTNGRVGLLGVSNPGRLVAMAMVEPHPAVRAYSPQATPADNFLGDDSRRPQVRILYRAPSKRPDFLGFLA